MNNNEGILHVTLPPLRDRDTGDAHADFHYRSYLPQPSALCVTCTNATSHDG